MQAAAPLAGETGSVSLPRRALAEALGTALLVTVVVGSGIMATRLSPQDVGVQLLENSIATAFGLTALILMFGSVSGAHLNPVVTAVDCLLQGRPLRDAAAYVPAQVLGAIGGAALANLMFDLPGVTTAGRDRSQPQLWLSEAVATLGLVLLIFALVRTGRTALAAPAVGAYIGAAYWFTSSTSFANPTVTIGRTFSDTFAGIAPASVPGFIAAQFLGAALGAALIAVFYPVSATAGTASAAADGR
ncbi:aquaporin family protein [Actinomadura madurae]|uniref:aquaporin n=1 Tax=Actinomadura madurae TaxID=1993 RepID=UPI002026F8E8|nr:MIP/aquaporin family protein [Actinomadura madurae]URN08901.1 aquaporin family protein [Actinomadura madurae]